MKTEEELIEMLRQLVKQGYKYALVKDSVGAFTTLQQVFLLCDILKLDMGVYHIYAGWGRPVYNHISAYFGWPIPALTSDPPSYIDG